SASRPYILLTALMHGYYFYNVISIVPFLSCIHCCTINYFRMGLNGKSVDKRSQLIHFFIRRKSLCEANTRSDSVAFFIHVTATNNKLHENAQ
ncbi:hypothetical protein ACJX0J_018231, partial [Zea mays]